VAFVERDDVIEQVAATASYPTLGDSVFAMGSGSSFARK